MKQFVRSHKLLWNIAFWILFFAVVILMVLTFSVSDKIIAEADLSKEEFVDFFIPVFSFLLAVLLIINRIYLVKGSVKRLPYFLSLLALFVLVGTIGVDDISNLFSVPYIIGYFAGVFLHPLFLHPI